MHAAAALAWLLWGLGLIAMGVRARRSRSGDAVTAFARLLSHPAVRVSTPALMALILVSGVWLVEADSEWSLTQPWIPLGLGLLAAAFLVGTLDLRRSAARLERVATSGPDREAARAAIGRWLSGYALVLAILVLAVWDMVAKPGL